MSTPRLAHGHTVWEARVISACLIAAVVTVTICLIILTIYATMFGYAQLKSHWP